MDKGQIFLLSAAHMSADINAAALPAALPFLAVAFGYSYTEVAGIMFCYSVAASLVQPLFGWLSDRLHCFALLPVSILLMGFSMGAEGWMPWYWGLWVCTALLGFGSALFHPEAATLVNVLAGREKGTAMSIFSVGGNMGFVLGPVIIALIVPAWGLKSTALFAAAGIVTALAVWVAFARMPAPQRKLIDEKRRPTGVNDWKAFAWLSGVLVNRSVFLQGFLSFTALYWMRVFGWTPSQGSFVLTFFSVAGVLSNLAGGTLSDRKGYVFVLRMTQMLSLPAVLCFAWSPSPWLSILLLAPIAFCVYASYSPMIILGQIYLSRNLGFAAGVTLGVARSAGGIAMPLMGLIADAYGLPTAFCCLGVPAALGLACAFRLPKVKSLG